MIDVTFTLNGEEKHLRVDPLRRWWTYSAKTAGSPA
jgi:hypothetical protein